MESGGFCWTQSRRTLVESSGLWRTGHTKLAHVTPTQSRAWVRRSPLESAGVWQNPLESARVGGGVYSPQHKHSNYFWKKHLLRWQLALGTGNWKMLKEETYYSTKEKIIYQRMLNYDGILWKHFTTMKQQDTLEKLEYFTLSHAFWADPSGIWSDPLGMVGIC